MKDAEKKLIENLFCRLKKTELNSFERDTEANSLIQDLVKNQPYSSYYMTQTILIQETAIKKLSLKVEELNKKISDLKLNQPNKKSSFLSNLFKKESIPSEKSNNIWKSNQNMTGSYNPLPVSPSTMSNSTSNSGSTTNNGFLKNALQTATGVAGGMVLGNMLMNIFNHSKPEEEVFDTIHESSISNIEDNEFHSNIEHNLVDYHNDDQSSFDVSENTSNFNDEYIDEISNSEDNSDINNDISDINDDNFI